MTRTAKRSKSLDVGLVDAGRAWFKLELEDRSAGPGGGELIHKLEIEGELSLPQLEILRIEPRTLHQPYAECGASLDPVRQMVGARVGPGFRARVLELMGRELGCTHYLTLMLDLGAAHTLSLFLRMRERASYAGRREPGSAWLRAGLAIEPKLEGACIALRRGSPVMAAASDLVNTTVDTTGPPAHPSMQARNG